MKPYAWVSLPENEIQILPFPDDGKTLVAGDGFYLYTHPVKELTQYDRGFDDGCKHTKKIYEAEIEAIKTHPVKELTDELFDKIFADGKRLGVLETEDRFCKAMQLTDEEILKVAANKFFTSEHRLVLLFARDLLRKAQEK